MGKVYSREDGVKPLDIFNETLSLVTFTQEYINKIYEENCQGCMEPECLANRTGFIVDSDDPWKIRCSISCPKWTRNEE